MGARAIRTTELTPETRIDMAKRALSDAVAELVAAEIARGAASADWVDQKSSPLGRNRHCELVRTHKLPGVKDGRRVLVRRSDLNAYLEAHRTVRAPENDDDVDGMIAAIVGGSQR